MKTVTEFTKDSSLDYLQSVVFVDDKIYNSPSHIEKGLNKKKTFTHPKVFASSSTKKSSLLQENEKQQENEIPYHPRDLMSSFAKKGIACALYEPEKKEDLTEGSILFNLCQNTDIVIFDWDLHKDDGDRVSSLIGNLIRSNEEKSPDHLRLYVIYTNKPSLYKVTNQIFESLKKNGNDVDNSSTSLTLHIRATKIIVLGKPSPLDRVNDEKGHVVPEHDLAERVIDEFSLLHRGVLPALTLYALGATRKHTKRLLDKFSSDLDIAFLAHRALVLEDTDVIEQIFELLGSEIHSILDDARTSLSINDVIHNRIDEIELEGCDTQRSTDLNRFLKNGCSQKTLRKYDSMLSPQNKKFSMLFCCRSLYNIETRFLKFGTVVKISSENMKNDSGSNYYLCIMPTCDSQRLIDERNSFPFWKLKELSLKEKEKGIGLTFKDGAKLISMIIAGKIRAHLHMIDFEIDNMKIVKTSKNQENRYIFKTINESSNLLVEWVAEIKQIHVQRISSYIGNEISKVGLTESEWLRSFCS